MMRVLVIGSGPNGLAAAFYLAKAGLRPIVLEKASVVGGGAVTAEIHPGFRAPIFSHEVLLHRRIADGMDLAAHGLRWIEHEVKTCVLSLEQAPLVLYTGVQKTAEAMRGTNAADADAWPRYRATMARVAEALAPLLTEAPPTVSARPGDLLSLFQTGRRVHRLDADARHLLRWLPMSVFDFTHEWFADERLRACIAGSAISGSMSAPRSGWSTLLLLLREAHEHLAGGRPLRAVGGPGACTQAMALATRAAGAELRTDTAVAQILCADHRVTGVVTTTGETIVAECIVSTLDPRTTLLGLVDRDALPTDVVDRLTHYRASGTLAKITLALDALPRFRGVDDSRLLCGRIQIGDRLDDLERAFDAVKYGHPSPTPWLEMQIPSLIDPGLAPSGAHVASIYVHNVPYKLRSAGGEQEREQLLARTLAIVEEYAPGFGAQVRRASIAAPVDFESTLGTAGGQIFHGELAPDQLLALRPVFGLGRYRTPVRGLYLGGAGTHPGGFMTGSSGRLAAEAILAN